ncbi:MAG: 50S ribosomal protein L30 [Candidatus Thermoplasmatota archaeon]|nr:50S ribosomal protein L30 [Euryarchaeota archaeon]MBU4031925.1 50S ribosomal protein L30 [Candidatus Thermoplasmatota archaeon]MBU4071512.1 50S ribosomal protein L30 [Candidatus Thermoplasmatota archaeon]MBU4144165.1 50S ribosomal protein L30 [Candidatus Thermoplasmatota archaeon]MBU4592799.1 50S ribosomal protein L30 [Candidatus Thermoplasmatota archaeon]
MIRAIIRLRSDIKAHREVKETLKYLRLNQVNHCVLIPTGKTYDGMLQKVKDYVTWGEIKTEVLTNMIIKRGKLSGDRPLTNQYVKDNTKHESLIKFTEAIIAGTCKYSDLKGVKPVFRLHPPRQGFEGIKRSYRDHGSLGYRGDAINELILKMLDTASLTPKDKAKAPAKPAVPEKAPAKKTPVPRAVEPVKAPAKKVAAPKVEEPAPKKAPAKKAPVKKKAIPKEESK